VALARALVREPRLFLLDEPLSNLDAVLREKTRTELKMLFSRIGGTVIYVTHDQAEAISMSGRVAVMKAGEILQIDSPLNIYNRPRSRFVAGFVGSPSISFIQAELEQNRLRFGDYSSPVEIGGDFSGPVLAGVRPEDVHLDPGVEDGPFARVVLVEPFGSYAVATLDHRGVSFKALVRPDEVSGGERVSFGIDSGRIHIFDKDTGRSLLTAAEKEA